MKELKIAASISAMPCFDSQREVIDVLHTDFTDVAAVVLSVQDINHGMINSIHELGLNIQFMPLFAAKKN
ncbi:Ornithine decarboxylase, inducible [Yersinia aldovae ATCC 35236]|nr:Ornithine decarboxylase, inducible [Yersinia aldovae ATCC 35236]